MVRTTMQSLDSGASTRGYNILTADCIAFLSYIVFLVKVVLLWEEVIRNQRSDEWEEVRRGAVAGQTLNYQKYLALF